MFKSSRKYWLIIAVAIALIAGSVERSGATLLTPDAGFDHGGTGWVGSVGSVWGVWDPSSTSFNVEPAGNVAWLNSGYIFEDLSTSANGPLGYLNAGHLYTLTVDVGYQTALQCPKCNSTEYTIDLLAGGVSFLSISGTGTPGLWEHVTTNRLASENDAHLGEKLEIRLGTGGKRTHFDNVTLTNNNVPEPSTLLLLGSGLVGVALFGKKKFKT